MSAKICMQTAAFASFVSATATIGHGATLDPAPVLPSELTIQLQEVAQLAPANFASPVAIDDDLYVIDQTGTIVRKTNNGFEQVFGSGDAPSGVTLASTSAVLNITGQGNTVHAVLRSSTQPTGIPTHPLPANAGYSGGIYDVVVRFDRSADGSLTNPVPITSFESTTTLGGHIGGGLLTLSDGTLVFARGDATGFRADGLAAPQNNAETVGKIILIDPTNGATTIAASGLRNPQRITFTDATETTIAIGDIGASTAEEINLISVADLQETTTIENFGWGRNADGNAREGTFYINDGEVSNPGTIATAIAMAPVPEPGFVQPFAQFGRENTPGFFAITGPVASETSFDQIGLLFDNLVDGSLFATKSAASGDLNDVFRVNAVDTLGNALALADFNNGNRIDPRFFNFANGDAGVLLERTGQMFLITEIAPVPLPAGALLMLTWLAALAVRRKTI